MCIFRREKVWCIHNYIYSHIICKQLTIIILLYILQIVYDRPAYHSERYLLPVGFHSSRTYPSMLSPSQRTTYHCRILDGGEQPIVSECKLWDLL